MYGTGLIPARFLIWVFHLILTIIVLMARDDNVLSCLRIRHSSSEYDILDVQIVGTTIVSFGLFVLEFISFIWAFSLTNHWQNLFSMLCHFAGVIILSLYLFDVWCSLYYWYVFFFCCFPPAVSEFAIWMCNFFIKKEI